MEKVISLFNWQEKFDDSDVASIGKDFMLLEKNIFKSTLKYPFKIDFTAVIICVEGTIECSINLKPVKAVSPCFLVLLPNQILEQTSRSDDFSGYLFVMSQKLLTIYCPMHRSNCL